MSRLPSVLLAATVFVLGNDVHAQVIIETVPVGNAGNAGELSGVGAGGTGPDRICGAVDYVYNIGKYEITAGLYAEFLNAVGATDTYGLYNLSMNSSQYGCQITQDCTGEDCTYDFSGRPSGTEADWADRPVNYVSWYDALRFANWMHNGQGSGDTETGTYILTGTTSVAECVPGEQLRCPNATWVIPSEDEWYKAAYHHNDGETGNYYTYPTSNDLVPVSEACPGGDNSANYHDADYAEGPPYYRNVVGCYDSCASPYGTSDQGGNVWEWNEAVIGLKRGLRGGSFYSGDSRNYLPAVHRDDAFPSGEGLDIGFRVADVSSECGNGIVEYGEACDDGNASNNDDCLADCTLPSCGDGFVWNQGSAPEQCDGDGTGTPGETAECDTDCTLAACPDGTLNRTAGEQCDDGNMSSDDECLNTCEYGIPTVSAWGVVAMALLMLTAGTFVLKRRVRTIV